MHKNQRPSGSKVKWITKRERKQTKRYGHAMGYTIGKAKQYVQVEKKWEEKGKRQGYKKKKKKNREITMIQHGRDERSPEKQGGGSVMR